MRVLCQFALQHLFSPFLQGEKAMHAPWIQFNQKAIHFPFSHVHGIEYRQTDERWLINSDLFFRCYSRMLISHLLLFHQHKAFAFLPSLLRFTVHHYDGISSSNHSFLPVLSAVLNFILKFYITSTWNKTNTAIKWGISPQKSINNE